MATSSSFLPPQHALAFYAGDDRTFTVTLLDDDDDPVDLTGATITAQIDQGNPGGTTLGGFTTAVVGPAANGVISLTMTAALSTSIRAALGNDKTPAYYDVEVKDAANKTRTYLAGTLTVAQQVSVPA